MMKPQPLSKKSSLAIIATLTVALVGALIMLIIVSYIALTAHVNLPTLPAPELSEGIRGEQFGIDKNINEATIDNYLGRPDSVYRDMRMLKDPGNYEAIGGDAYLSGFVKGFEVVPLPYLVNVTGLPEEVGATYSGKTLFALDSAGNYLPNYDESLQILEDLFPKDRYIFLMCGGGGYAGMTKQMLIALGWDADKIYNVGAYWSYDGKNKVEVKTTVDGETTYAFWKVPYHNIDFTAFHPRTLSDEFYTKPGITPTDIKKLKSLIADKKSFAVFVSQPACQTADALRAVLKDFIAKHPMQILEVSFSSLQNSGIADDIRFYPSFIIFRNGQIVDFLDADDDADAPAYKNLDAFTSWFGSYITLRD